MLPIIGKPTKPQFENTLANCNKNLFLLFIGFKNIYDMKILAIIVIPL